RAAVLYSTCAVAIVKIFVASRRPCAADAFATSSYGTYVAHPFVAATFVIAAANVVFPCSTCPLVPTFTCGFVRSNLTFPMIPSTRAWSGASALHLAEDLLGLLLRHFLVVA